MSATGPDGPEEFEVRLRWPGEVARPEPLAAPVDPELVAEPIQGLPEPTFTVGGSVASRGLMFDAFDRLADRILGRFRSLADDLRLEFAELRTELGAIRQSVEDVADRVEMRRLRATLDELRSDVTGLRRAVLEWPELEQVGEELVGLRADMTQLLGGEGVRADRSLPSGPSINAPRAEGESTVPMGRLGPLIEEVAGLREAVDRLVRLQDDLAAAVVVSRSELGRQVDDLRVQVEVTAAESATGLQKVADEVARTRRRIPLRADPA